jgi:hypothetical protein
MEQIRYRLTEAELNGRLARLCYEDIVAANPYQEFTTEWRQFAMGWVYVDKHPEASRLNCKGMNPC